MACGLWMLFLNLKVYRRLTKSAYESVYEKYWTECRFPYAAHANDLIGPCYTVTK